MLTHVILPCFLFSHIISTFENEFYYEWVTVVIYLALALIIGVLGGYFLASVCFKYSNNRERGLLYAFLAIPDIGPLQFGLVVSSADYINKLA